MEKRGASGANYLITSTASTANDKLALGYSNDSTVSHSQSGVAYDSTVSGYASSSGKPKIFTFVSDSTSGKKIYINGTLVNQSANNAQVSGITSLDIGKNYNGEIGEIAIFTRALKGEERKSIEDYIGKKWTTKITRDSIPSCIGYTMTIDSCDLSTATCSISATGVSASVAAASSPTTTTCNANHYSGNVTYTCINGTANITSNNCICSTGYTGSGCNSCDSPNYLSNGSGGCIAGAGCSVSATGITTTPVAHNSSGSITCGSGYSGTINYNCNNGNPGITGSCSVSSPCTGGNSVTTVTISSVSYTLHQFTSIGTFNLNCPTAKTTNVLIVAGGGGGGGDAGSNSVGGIGMANSITGSTTYYGGGGGGGRSSVGAEGINNVHATMSGGGGRDAGSCGGNFAVAGTANTGGGGAPHGCQNYGAAGGSGIVIVRYPN